MRTGTILRQNQRTLDTGLQGVVSNDTTTPVFNALTPPLNSAQVETVRTQIYLAAVGACEVRPAVQFSEDGVNWTDSAKELSASYESSEGWSYGSSFTNIFNLAGTTPRLFVRFGVQARNTSGSLTEGAMVRMIVEMAPVNSATIPVPYQKVWTKGSTVSDNFVPVTGPIPTDGISELRTTIELASSSGDIEVQFGWQETNTPDDESSWSTPNAVGSATSTEGIVFGTTFSSVSPTKKYLRGGIGAVNVSGSDVEAARVSVRLDVR